MLESNQDAQKRSLTEYHSISKEKEPQRNAAGVDLDVDPSKASTSSTVPNTPLFPMNQDEPFLVQTSANISHFHLSPVSVVR